MLTLLALADAKVSIHNTFITDLVLLPSHAHKIAKQGMKGDLACPIDDLRWFFLLLFNSF